MTAYREPPKVIERVRRVGWAWPAAYVIVGVCLSIPLTRIVGCARESSARDAAEATKCHDTVLIGEQTSCPHVNQVLGHEYDRFVCRCTHIAASTEASSR